MSLFGNARKILDKAQRYAQQNPDKIRGVTDKAAQLPTSAPRASTAARSTTWCASPPSLASVRGIRRGDGAISR
jgi:hypothetical protein